MIGRQGHGPAGAFGDPGRVVIRLHGARQLDGGLGLGHAGPVVGLERRLADQRQRPDFAEVQMRVDEGLGDQVFPGVDLPGGGPSKAFADRGNTPVGDAQVEQAARPAPQTGVADQDVVALRAVCHGLRSSDPGSGTAFRR